MQRLRRGDPAGLEALMDRYTPYLSAIAARVLPGRPQDWEELTADVFLAAWENRRKLQPEKVKGWLAVTMRNRCINRLRALREEELPLEEELLTLTADSPQRALEDQEAARLAREALEPWTGRTGSSLSAGTTTPAPPCFKRKTLLQYGGRNPNREGERPWNSTAWWPRPRAPSPTAW